MKPKTRKNITSSFHLSRGKIISLVLLLFFFSANILIGQSSKVIGTVIDKDTGDPLFGANVFIEGTSIGAATDIDGKYVLPIVPLGEHTIIVRFIGFDEQRLTFELANEKSTLELNFELKGVALEGQEVIISAQAMGQKQAINQQISSNTIKNVVSAARIQELPDATAAESIGRLPGVSISRSGGEANKVLVRGLVPHVQVDGVSIGSVEQSNRNVDISMISPSMLDGIDLTKALTADMEADRLGGTVNLSVRKAPQEFYRDITVQGGFDAQEKSYSNYKLVGAIADRFFDKKLGIYFNAYIEERDRGTDILNPNFDENFTVPEEERDQSLRLNSMNFQDRAETRSRYGGTLVFDYELPFGAIKFTNFGSRMNKDQLTHAQNMSGFEGNNLNSSITKSGDNFVNQIANRMFGEFDLFTGKLDVELSHSYAGADRPRQRYFNWFSGYELSIEMKSVLPYKEWVNNLEMKNLENWSLRNVTETKYYSLEREYKAAIDYELPFSLGDFVTGSFKFGVLYKHNNREFDTDQRGVNIHGDDYDVWKAIQAADPDIWINRNNLGELSPYDIYDDHFKNEDFLDGKYNLQPFISLDMFDKVHDIVWKYYKDNNILPSVPTSNFTNDQNGTEQMTAGYVMPTFKIFNNFVTFIPGFRYEKMEYEYSGNNLFVPVGIETTSNYWTEDLLNRDTSTTIHESWFPMFHLKFQPFDWFDLRLAYTKTALRPNYDDIIPSSIENSNTVTINRGNPFLKPQLAENWDLYASFYNNDIGFLSVGAFKKNITDGIIRSAIYIPDSIEAKRFDLDENYLGFSITTPLNSNYTEYIQGFEIDWQTHFWYLPFPFDGLVLNINYTYLESESTTYLPIIAKDNSSFPPKRIRIDSSYTTNQFKNFFNVSLGYDYKGFSARISYLYQARTKTSFQQRDYLNTYKFPYSRVDLKLRQKLPVDGLELFVNLNNLEGTGDEFYQQSEFYIDLEERWGFTGDVGLRYRL